MSRKPLLGVWVRQLAENKAGKIKLEVKDETGKKGKAEQTYTPSQLNPVCLPPITKVPCVIKQWMIL